MTRGIRGLAASLLLVGTLRAAGSPARPFGFDRPAEGFEPASGFRLGATPIGIALPRLALPGTPAAGGDETPSRRVFDRDTSLVAAGAALTALTIGYLTWWRDRTGRFASANEEWFGADTYAGGADKASHMTFSFNAEWGLESAYRAIGRPAGEALWLAFGTVAAIGLLLETGDGFSEYGFSWEDAASNTIGAGFSALVSHFGLRDTIGMRVGRVKALIPDPCCRAGVNVGSDYSKEVYSLDLRLSGFLPRVGVKDPGPARLLLVSLTYGSKGYRFSPVDHQERNLGLDVGLNLPEILRACGVRDGTWWGDTLLTFFSVIRIPYTAFGFRYDFNHHKWSGWDTGDHFDPGSVFYD